MGEGKAQESSTGVQDPFVEPEGYTPPQSAGELLERYKAGARYFKGAELEGANLIGAHLEGANLIKADLRRANLRRANLLEADLRRADLRGANLLEADLQGANVAGVCYQERTLDCDRYAGIRVEGAYGDPLFVRYAKDQDYLAAFKRQHIDQFWIWEALADCGRSWGRWTVASLGMALGFGLLFFCCADWFNAPAHGWTPFTPFYYSFVTFTTLGFGDVTPACLAGEIAVTVEVVLGYVMLGGLVSLLAHKLARRS